MADEESSISAFSDKIKQEFDLAQKFVTISDQLETAATNITKSFGQTKERIVEIKTAVADVIPEFNQLGGGIRDVVDTIQSISESSRRNVIATTEQTEKLFAAFKVTNVEVGRLVNSFTDVGVGLGQMGKQIESSVNYIRSIGGNTKEVFKTVTENMDQLNRFQFEGGVVGLTKMAAQASMLRFDMKETFSLADRVLDPEKAVEVASAFQRLGVSAGNLADPFQLMNESINDPSGLQNSLSKVAQQFTRFDEETKTFKINPQGVLILREMENQAGLTRGSLSKMGLAAAELNQRVSQISPEIKFKNEEDKQYLTNIAKMGDQGKYIVELEDGTKKELSQLNQKEFDKLIEQQKNAPQTLEDIAKGQMTISESILNNVKSITNAVVGGAATSPTLLQGLAGFDRIAKTVTGELAKTVKPSESRKVTETVLQDFESLIKDIKGGKAANLSLADFADKINTQSKDFEGDIKKGLVSALERVSDKLGKNTYGEALLKDLTAKLTDKVGGNVTPPKSATAKIDAQSPIYNRLLGDASNVSTKTSSSPNKSQVDFAGGIKVDVKFTGAENYTPQQLEQFTKLFNDKMNSTEIQTLIKNISSSGNPTKSPLNTSVGNK
jgi:hypothetical protein